MGGSHQGLQRQEPRTVPSAETLPARRKKWPWAGCGLCSPFTMHGSQHGRHGSATHLRNTGNDPSARSKAQAPQVPPERPIPVSHSWYFTLHSPLLACGCSGPHITPWSFSSIRNKPQGGGRSDGHTSAPGHYSKLKASPARLAPPELQSMRLFTVPPLACSPRTPVRPAPLYCQH